MTYRFGWVYRYNIVFNSIDCASILLKDGFINII